MKRFLVPALSSITALAAFPAARLVALDRDKEALRLSGERLAPYGDRATLVHAVYDELPEVLERLGIPKVQGVLFDLGVSSMQLDVRDRGFAYSEDAPLDMRMDPTTGQTAADLLNTATPQELTRILREYGEEKFASRIAREVVRRRETAPFATSAELVELLQQQIPVALTEMRRCLESGDGPGLQRVAHKLRGSVLQFGAGDAAAAALALETLAREGAVPDAGFPLPALEEALARLMSEIGRFAEVGSP